MKKSLLGFALVLAAAAVSAKAEKLPVHIDCTTGDDDWIGKQICSALRDQLARSPRYREAGGKENQWTLHVVSMTDTKASSVQAISESVGPGDGVQMFMTGYVYATGEERVKFQAERMFSAFDNDVKTILDAVK